MISTLKSSLLMATAAVARQSQPLLRRYTTSDTRGKILYSKPESNDLATQTYNNDGVVDPSWLREESKQSLSLEKKKLPLEGNLHADIEQLKTTQEKELPIKVAETLIELENDVTPKELKALEEAMTRELGSIIYDDINQSDNKEGHKSLKEYILNKENIDRLAGVTTIDALVTGSVAALFETTVAETGDKALKTGQLAKDIAKNAAARYCLSLPVFFSVALIMQGTVQYIKDEGDREDQPSAIKNLKKVMDDVGEYNKTASIEAGIYTSTVGAFAQNVTMQAINFMNNTYYSDDPKKREMAQNGIKAFMARKPNANTAKLFKEAMTHAVQNKNLLHSFAGAMFTEMMIRKNIPKEQDK